MTRRESQASFLLGGFSQALSGDSTGMLFAVVAMKNTPIQATLHKDSLPEALFGKTPICQPLVVVEFVYFADCAASHTNSVFIRDLREDFRCVVAVKVT